MRVITRKGSNRVAREAFELARTRPRKKVTAAHKEPVYRLACGMFAEECRKVAKEYPDVTFDEMMIDSIAMKLVIEPQRFDVVVTTNQFGDILTDIGAGLVGGLGLAPGLCVGETPGHGAGDARLGARYFRAQHRQSLCHDHVRADAARLARPQAQGAEGQRRRRADASGGDSKVIAEGKHLTRDLGGKASTHGDGRRHRRRGLNTPRSENSAQEREEDNATRVTTLALAALGLVCLAPAHRARASLAATGRSR